MKKLLLALAALIAVSPISGLGEQLIPSGTPVIAATPVPVSEYTYKEVTSKTLGMRFLYPSHWENLPGRATVCFREPRADGGVPARMAISVKHLSKRANDDKMQSELVKYMKAIVAQYDSYEVGNLSTDTDFMGKDGYSTIYKGVKDGQTVRGYAIMACVGTKIYAFHFSAGEQDYQNMATVMQHVRDNIKAAN
ncbi:MAG: hypothetical protein GX592_06590 [Clostridiales bacterium]|nr:hypothetical protein [Clostridiales bacterium]